MLVIRASGRVGGRLDQRSITAGSSLANLLEETSRGNHAAFRALYEPGLAKTLRRRAAYYRNRPMAEEVLQETFVKIWQKAERFSPEAGQPMAWLAAIARNRAIDRIRAEKVERSQPSDDESALERLAAPDTGDPATREALCGSALGSSTTRRGIA